MGNQMKTSRRPHSERMETGEEATNTPQSNSVSSVESRKSLVSPKCGQWEGTYQQYGTAFPFSMDLMFFDDQRVSGSGYDEIGGYDIKGDFNRLTGQISFDKVYRQMHTVQYSGSITEDGRSISGVYWNTSPFQMSVTVVKPITPVVFKLTQGELDAGVLHIKYASNSDEYIRVNNDSEHIQGWSNGIFQEENMYRKTEHDWKMTYLSRSPDTSSEDAGSICWRFDLGDYEVDYLKLIIRSTTFKNGEVSWSIISDDSRVVDLDELLHGREADEGFPGNVAHFSGEDPLTVQGVHRCSGFILKAQLSKGEEDVNVAWQCAQLFRQPQADKDVFPFDVQIFIKKLQDWQMLKSLNEANKYMYDHRHLASDVAFRVGLQQTPVIAHKYVLITRSPIFYTMFYGGLPHDADHQVVVPDVEEPAFQEFLRFLYCDEVSITPDNVFELFYAAKKYFVTSLTKKCIRFIITQLSTENSCSVLTHAVMCDEVQLIAQTITFIYDNLQDILDNQTYKDLSMDVLVHLLKDSPFETDSEEFKKMIKVWLSEECNRRQIGDTENNRKSVLLELHKQCPFITA